MSRAVYIRTRLYPLSRKFRARAFIIYISKIQSIREERRVEKKSETREESKPIN